MRVHLVVRARRHQFRGRENHVRDPGPAGLRQRRGAGAGSGAAGRRGRLDQLEDGTVTNAAPRKARRAYTLIEVLVVISIIALLMSLIGIVAARARAKARVSRTKSLIKRIHVAMDAYQALWRVYPAGAPTHPDTWPDPYDLKGVELEKSFLTDRDPVAKFEVSDLDPTDDKYLVDAWGSRIRYRKVGPNRMLIWSLGPNKVDEIGNDTAKKRERIPKDDTTFPGADDISHVESDY
ncbi:MAG: type II secretion system protein [Planctomycetota bacterium]|nr:type II secretion system protein [Planctomycetota bacterium]